ncbi:unnamed protein product, partial [Owenia fusiformis]
MHFAGIARVCLLFFLLCILGETHALTPEEVAWKQEYILQGLKSSELGVTIDSISALQVRTNNFLEAIDDILIALDKEIVKRTVKHARKYYRRMRTATGDFGESRPPLIVEAFVDNEARLHQLRRSSNRMLSMIMKLREETNNVNQSVKAYETSKNTLVERTYDFCMFPVCGINGRCVIWMDGNYCNCRPHYTGTYCEIKTEERCPQKCMGKIGMDPAPCLIQYDFQTCACPDKFMTDGSSCVQINPPPQWYNPPQETECPSSLSCKGTVNGAAPPCFLVNSNGLIQCKCPDDPIYIDPDTGM